MIGTHVRDHVVVVVDIYIRFGRVASPTRQSSGIVWRSRSKKKKNNKVPRKTINGVLCEREYSQDFRPYLSVGKTDKSMSSVNVTRNNAYEMQSRRFVKAHSYFINSRKIITIPHNYGHTFRVNKKRRSYPLPFKYRSK